MGRVWRVYAGKLLHQGEVLVGASQDRHRALRLRDLLPACRRAVRKHEDCDVDAVKKGLSRKGMISGVFLNLVGFASFFYPHINVMKRHNLLGMTVP